jgi:hypothetical protein
VRHVGNVRHVGGGHRRVQSSRWRLATGPVQPTGPSLDLQQELLVTKARRTARRSSMPLRSLRVQLGVEVLEERTLPDGSLPSVLDPWGGDPRTFYQADNHSPPSGPLLNPPASAPGGGPDGPIGPGPANVLVNDPTLDHTVNDTQSETSLLAFGNTVLVGYNDSGSNAISSSKFTGWSRSTDGGATFTDMHELPTNPLGDRGDPVLARDNTTGTIYFATIGLTGISVFRSFDSGATFTPAMQGTPGATGTQDKEWITVDNFAGPGSGNVYLLDRDFGGGNGIYLYRSTDGGATFGPSGGRQIVAATGRNVQGAYVAVGPNHEVCAAGLSVRRLLPEGREYPAPSECGRIMLDFSVRTRILSCRS